MVIVGKLLHRYPGTTIITITIYLPGIVIDRVIAYDAVANPVEHGDPIKVPVIHDISGWISVVMYDAVLYSIAIRCAIQQDSIAEVRNFHVLYDHVICSFNDDACSRITVDQTRISGVRQPTYW